MAGVVVAARKIEMIGLQRKAEPARRRIQHAQTFRDDFLADPVSGDHGNAVGLHGVFRLKVVRCCVGWGFRRRAAWAQRPPPRGGAADAKPLGTPVGRQDNGYFIASTFSPPCASCWA